MLQPFKSITLEFGGASSNGVKEVTGAGITEGGKNIDPIVREMGTGMYGALKLKGGTSTDGYTAAMATTKTDQVVGVLTEVFKNTHVGAEVMVSGIVNMKAAGVITPGDQVTVQGNGKIQKVTAGDSYFGIALTEAKAANEYVDVLLQIGGLKA